MTWFRVDDSFPSHPKTRRIPRVSRMAVIGAWTTLGTYSAKHLTDGLVTAQALRDEGATLAQASRLVEVSLWHPPGISCGHPSDQCPGAPPDGHYQFHDWYVYQPSRLQVLAERAAAAERQRRARERAKEKRGGGSNAGSNGVGHGVTTPVSHGPPDPTRPDPTFVPSERTSSPATPEPHQRRIGLAKSDDDRDHEPHPGGKPLDRHGHPRHDHEPNARTALTAIRRERRLGVEVALLLGEAYRIGAGDPWAGYLAINAETEKGLRDAWARSGATLDRIRRLGPQRVDPTPDWLREA